MPIGPPEGFLDITNATLRTSVVGISNTGPTGELSVGSNLHVDTTASNVLQVVGNVSSHNMTLGEISLVPAHGLENVTEVGNTTPYTVSFSNATTGLATTSNLHVGGTLKIGTVEFENPLSLAAVSLVSNTTPYTIEFSNAATGIATTANVDVGGELAVTGNATVSSNLTVTGDLNVVVGGDLIVGGTSLVNAIYPVGTVIDRATAITDTHLNGKYKAFLAAPNQEWELVDNGSNTVVLENLLQSGETNSFCGRATLTPATAAQALSGGASGGAHIFTVLTGSEITNFTPVLGTKKVKYSFQFHHAMHDIDGLANYQLEVKIDSGSWTTVPDTSVSAFASNYYNAITEMAWVITLDDIDDVSSGRTTAVRPVLGIRVIGREFSSTHEAQVHNSKYHNAVDSNHFRPPLLEVKCLGPKANLEYKRTV